MSKIPADVSTTKHLVFSRGRPIKTSGTPAPTGVQAPGFIREVAFFNSSISNLKYQID
ncbi:hypothetical protein NDI47_18005 [Microcoleus vaginatus GB1-A2]|nr:hypothetical protein [Microcoleus sp. FACHB-61]